MAKLSKRFRLMREKVLPGKTYTVLEAITLLKEFPVKFNQSVDVSINLGIDSRKSDQVVRGAVVLPHGTGKTPRVAVFAQAVHAEAAKAAGADIVGFDDLAETIKAGNFDFDVLIATPDAMRLVGQLGPLLGPRGLMPNPKIGTVTMDVATAVSHAKSGQVRYRADKGGIIHCTIGKLNFEPEQLLQNLEVLINVVKKAKPTTAKGVYLKKLSLSSTMGPGLSISLASLDSTP
ncbi:50S ribosomal protein L1 [Rickettsiella grylli]|uniref:Large ribosomal subunit protein uL1 n=1 Tax=Rickettsiella grylli TaxID=59196 RepID=A8PNR5_9COXI|nr:50S ribosomal protein L1 [Rickettsiella grylli]EDP46333.1 ribosomal protein L1 [Rickettsiella grylli]OIZ99398.1 50S ribosomal protein L1 [Rickettsiella grylli]